MGNKSFEMKLERLKNILGCNRDNKHPDSLSQVYGTEVADLLLSLYIILVTFGVILNITVIIALLQHKALNNITNIFVLALACSDIVLCAVNMSVQAYYEIKESIANNFVCYVLFPGFGLPMYVSCLTIMLIAIDRHNTIIYPLRQRMSSRTAVILILAVIIFSAVNSMPVSIYMSIQGSHCVEKWSNQILRFVYSIGIFTLHFLSPLMVSAVLYLRIYRRLCQRTIKKKENDKKKRTNKILMSVVACFAICWTPWCLYSLLLALQTFLNKQTYAMENNDPVNNEITKQLCGGGFPISPQVIPPPFPSLPFMGPENNATEFGKIELIPSKHVRLIELLLKLFAMGSTCVNPFIYGWLNEPIRDSMIKLGRRIIGKPQPRRGTYQDCDATVITNRLDDTTKILPNDKRHIVSIPLLNKTSPAVDCEVENPNEEDSNKSDDISPNSMPEDLQNINDNVNSSPTVIIEKYKGKCMEPGELFIVAHSNNIDRNGSSV